MTPTNDFWDLSHYYGVGCLDLWSQVGISGGDFHLFWQPCRSLYHRLASNLMDECQ